MIETWMPPQGTLSNDAFSVFVRDSDSDKYEKLFTYNVRVGHQDDSWNDSSMVIFDFDDTVQINWCSDNHCITWRVFDSFLEVAGLLFTITHCW